MKNTYDIAPNARGCAHAWTFGFFEKTHALVSSCPFNSDNYVIVEGQRAFYRIAKSDLDDWQIRKFLEKI